MNWEIKEIIPRRLKKGQKIYLNMIFCSSKTRDDEAMQKMSLKFLLPPKIIFLFATHNM